MSGSPFAADNRVAIQIIQDALATHADSAAALAALEMLTTQATDLAAARSRNADLEGQLRRHREELAALRELTAAPGEATDSPQKPLDRAVLSDISRLKTDFVLSVSHELRTPMAIVKGSLDALDLNWPNVSDERRRAYVSVGRRGANRLKRLLENLLLISRIETDSFQPRLEPVDVAAVAASAIAEVSVGWPRLPVTNHAPASLPLVWADRALASEAISYLLENAHKSALADTPIAVALSATDDEVIVRLGDPEVVGQRADAAAIGPCCTFAAEPAAVASGACLDLQIAQQMVTRVGGRVWSENTVGNGEPGRATYGLALRRLDRKSALGAASSAKPELASSDPIG